MSTVLYRTYRPATFGEVTGQEHVVRTIQNQYAGQSLAHAYLFTGPRGVGKTTTARLIAKLVNCENPKGSEPCNTCLACTQIAAGQAMDVYELDAASHTDVENVRETIIQSVRFAPSRLKRKVYIIDEVHMLSASAFNALLKTLEEPPEHALFILATTEIHKVPETIISRCQRFDFRKIPLVELEARLARIVKEEGVKVDEEVLREIARLGEGCARDAESLLGQVLALGEKEIGMKEASLVLPMTQTVLVADFLVALKGEDAKQTVQLLNTYLEQGVDLQHFVSDTVRALRDELMAAVGSGAPTRFLEGAIDELLKASRSIRHESIPQLPVELATIRICSLLRHPEERSDEGSADRIEKDFKKQEAGLSQAIPPLPEGGLGGVGGTMDSPTVFDTVPIISLDEVKEKWPLVYEQIKSCNASLPLMMQECEVSGIAGGQVEIGLEFDLYVQTINQDKNRRVIEEVLEKVLGKRLRIKAVRKAQDQLVSNLVEAFGGTVV